MAPERFDVWKSLYSPNLCDSEVSQAGEITEGLWRYDPPTESWYFISPSKASHASNETSKDAFHEELTGYFNKGVFHANGVALRLIFKMIMLYKRQHLLAIYYEGVKLKQIPTIHWNKYFLKETLGCCSSPISASSPRVGKCQCSERSNYQGTVCKICQKFF